MLYLYKVLNFDFQWSFVAILVHQRMTVSVLEVMSPLIYPASSWSNCSQGTIDFGRLLQCFLNVLFKRSYPRDIEWFLANDLARELFYSCNAHKPGWDGKGKVSFSSFSSKRSRFKYDVKVALEIHGLQNYAKILKLMFTAFQRWQILFVVEHCYVLKFRVMFWSHENFFGFSFRDLENKTLAYDDIPV